MTEGLRTILGFIVENLVLDDEIRDIDLNASATESGSDISAARAQTTAREMAAAEALVDPFVQGIVLAAKARATGPDGITLDDRVPTENAMADALIRYLVSFELAESHTAETEPMHYTYRVVIDWPGLTDLAKEAGVDLEVAISEASKS